MEPLLSLPPDQFRAALAELQLDPQREADLVRQYRRANSPLAPIYGLLDRVSGQDAGQGMQRASMVPVARPEGMSVAEAVRSGEARLAVPQGVLDAIGALVGGIDAPGAAARGLISAQDMPAEALGTAGVAMGAGGLLSRPAGSVGMGGRVARDFDVSRRDASNIFGEGSERVRYTDPQSGGTMEVVVRPSGQASVLELEVPEGFRGQGIGQALQARVMQDFPVMGGQVSSKAAATTAYRLGRRPYGMPDATLEDVFRMIDEDSSVNLISPAAQPTNLAANRSTTTGLLTSAAETPAQRVARLLREGRASEVTDDLMAQADPQEMYRLYVAGETGMDLPMDEASRMVRAAGQGYDISRPMYHGTDTDFLSVNTNMGTGERYKTGFFTSDNPNVAASYAPNRDRGMVLPVFSRASDQGVVIDAQGANWNRIDAASPARYGNSALANEFPELVGDENAYSYFSRMYDDLMGLRELSTNAMARERRFEGDPSITFENVIDRGPYSLTDIQAMSASQPSRVAVDFYPQNVRSRFARFDPRLSHLANLNAANVSPIAGLLAILQAQEQQR